MYEWINGNFIVFQESFGLGVFKATKDGIELSYDTERISSAVEKLYRIIYETKGGYRPETAAFATSAFNEGRSLFYFDSLGLAASDLRNGDIDYGILCIPKLNEEQHEYIVGYTDYLHGIPITVKDRSAVGLIIEAMSAAGEYYVYPVYIEAALKNKYAYDAQSADVIDIVNKNRVFDLAYMLGSSLSNALLSLLTERSTDVASYFAENESQDLQLINRLIDVYY